MDRGYYYGRNPPPPAPLDDVELHATDTCPRNYIIVDQSESRSRIMFNPSLAHKSTFQSLAGPSFDPAHGPTPAHKEDSDEIEALLSLTDDGTEEDDDVTSTGRSSPGESKGKKKKKIKNMVKKLRGMIPGGEQMDTSAVLDEAVKYLKSLKGQVKKLHHN